MNKYIQDWLEIIENMNNDNTYKLAWGRAIIEIAMSLKIVEENNLIKFEMIAYKMIKYYWNQIFFFDLKQSANSKKPPVLVQQVELLINQYKFLTDSSVPIWFDKAEAILKQNNDFYYRIINKSARKLKDDVSWRFMNVNKKTLNIYHLDKENLYIVFNKQQIMLIQEYHFILSQLLNYKWAQLLERYNNAPRIASKVKGISSNTLKRNNLSKYKKLLLESCNYNPIDFYTGEILQENNISLDHVISWSFMYSDDIWNLVFTSKSSNSSKSNNIPKEEIIKRLKERNQLLLNTITDPKYKNELEIAIQNNYIDKFYLAIKL